MLLYPCVLIGHDMLRYSLMFFFFKQKTAYEMRISDWSSDVCSSDLHRDAEGAVAGEAHHRQVGAADLGADDRGKAVAAGPEKARRQVLAAFLEGRIGVADGAVVADVRRADGLARQRRLDGHTGHARRQLRRASGRARLCPSGKTPAVRASY